MRARTRGSPTSPWNTYRAFRLRSFTDPKKLLAPKRALELAATTAEALDYAHNQGVIHRDIKPANLLYNPKEGSLKISDFGVARMTDNNSTKTGIVLGTPMYMSPEQLGAENLTGLSDLFSLGVTLYELLVGEVPFRASNIAVLMTKITTEDPGAGLSTPRRYTSERRCRPGQSHGETSTDRFSCGAEMAIALRNCAEFHKNIRAIDTLTMSLRGKIELAEFTDTGRVRDHNEDAIGSNPDIGLMVLADGMGGYNAGEVASGIAVQIVTELAAEGAHREEST